MCNSSLGNQVTIILVNYNGKNYLAKCLESIYSQTHKNISIVVVDNYSQDGSAEYLKKFYTDIHVIECEENTGFAKGNNIGIEYAISQGADYVLLLNVDTWIDEKMVECLLQNATPLAVAVPKIYCDRRMMKTWYAGGEIDYEKGNSYHCQYTDSQAPKKISFACGCCILIHKSIIRQVGLFDEKYYLYFEDTDLSMRFTQNHIDINFVPTARMWHKIGGSGGSKGRLIKTYYMVRNQLYFVRKFSKEMKTKRICVVIALMKKYILCNTDKELRYYAWKGIRDFYFGKMYEAKWPKSIH